MRSHPSLISQVIKINLFWLFSFEAKKKRKKTANDFNFSQVNWLRKDIKNVQLIWITFYEKFIQVSVKLQKIEIAFLNVQIQKAIPLIKSKEITKYISSTFSVCIFKRTTNFPTFFLQRIIYTNLKIICCIFCQHQRKNQNIWWALDVAWKYIIVFK